MFIRAVTANSEDRRAQDRPARRSTGAWAGGNIAMCVLSRRANGNYHDISKTWLGHGPPSARPRGFSHVALGPETFRPRAAINTVEMTSAGSSCLSVRLRAHFEQKERHAHDAHRYRPLYGSRGLRRPSRLRARQTVMSCTPDFGLKIRICRVHSTPTPRRCCLVRARNQPQFRPCPSALSASILRSFDSATDAERRQGAGAGANRRGLR